MGDEQRFTEDEVSAILTRAVELERTGLSSPDVAGSISLNDLKEIVEERSSRHGLVTEALGVVLGRGIWEVVQERLPGSRIPSQKKSLPPLQSWVILSPHLTPESSNPPGRAESLRFSCRAGGCRAPWEAQKSHPMRAHPR